MSFKLHEQYDTLERQDHASRLGVWVFLASEVMLFAGLFALYGAYRALYPHDFGQAEAHNSQVFGVIMTLVLLTSSLTVALSVWAARRDRPRLAALLLVASIGMGLGFLALKGTEWAIHMREGIFPGHYYRFHELDTYGAHAFFTLYYFLTGLHALHVTAGLVILSWIAVRAWRRAYTAERHNTLELGTLYWHLVDVIWIFLWPLLYRSH